MTSRFSPVVMSSKQERQAGGGGSTIWYSSGNSGKDLWKLKANNPELFNKKGDQDEVPAGFEPMEKPGWYYNRADKIFFVKFSRKFFWLDEASGQHKELYEGQTLPLAFIGGAASLAEDASKVEAGSKAVPAPKTVVIPDLHRVASALKVDLSHIDRPTSMMGVFGGSNDVAARGFHEKLVRRLGANRSRWADSDLVVAARGAMEDVTAGQACSVPAAVVVLTGRRAAALCTPGAAYRLTLRPAQASTATLLPASNAAAVEAKASMASSFISANEQEALFAAVSVGSTGDLEQEAFEGGLARQLLKGWARTACISSLHSARRRGSSGPLGTACARLVPTDFTASASSSSEAPAAKRQKLGSASPIFSAGTAGASSGGKGDQVRVRQILLRIMALGPPVLDPVRRKQVKRSQEEAEGKMLEVLQGLEADGMASFQKVCREVSECQSALKGGELAGDMGWLDRVKGVGIQQDKAKVAVRPQVPAAVLKAAFELAVGEVHDLVTTELGVHLLQRTA